MFLNCHSYYSYRYGILSEEALLQQAAALGLKTIALTDINYTSACLNFIRLAPKYQIKPVIGIDFRQDSTCLYIGLAKNKAGFKALNGHLSLHKHQHTSIPPIAPELENCFIIYPFSQLQQLDLKAFKDYEYIGLSPGDLHRFRFSAWKHLYPRCVALLPVTFSNQQDFNTHRLLRAIDQNTLLSKLSVREQGHVEDRFQSPEVVREWYKDFPEVLSRSEALLDACDIHFNFGSGHPSQNRKSYTGDHQQDWNLLLQLCKEGLPYRYPKDSTIIQQRIEKELNMIRQMNFVSFFLINWDIIRYAQHKNYYHVGRGSGANSIVAYILGITDVDPIELDLYFERFMNLYRSSPPDFDIDFSTQERPDMTRYIFQRFGGGGRAALLGAYSTFQYSAAVRELGKVFGLPKHEIDLLSDGKVDLNKADQHTQLIVRYARRIENRPNYLTIHAAGILISEDPIHCFSATDMPPKGFPTVHFDMHIAEDAGLHKFDILGQRGLGKIRDSLSIIRQNHPEAAPIDIRNTREMMQDPKVNALIKSSQCIGCFYIESPAMRTLIKKLEVDNYLTLVAASSIIRPGVAQSGMMREYILRHKDPERRKLAHPILYDIMPDTYGVMVYQEDVIKVAHHFAGLDLGQADVLRRGMSGKYRSREEFQQVKDQYFINCRMKGYDDTLATEVWHQIESFAGYAFAKGHSASYAVESYQSLYLKTYYPLEYMVAVINNGGGYYNTELYVHEARRWGATVKVCCINTGVWETCISGKTITLGMGHILNIEYQSVKQIIEERNRNGPFLSLHDFMERVDIPREMLQSLIRIGAFAFTGDNKRKLLWKALFAQRREPKSVQQYKLFVQRPKHFVLPELPVSEAEEAFEQMELLGFPLVDPFLLGKNIHDFPKTSAAEMDTKRMQYFSIVGYLITIKYTRTQKGETMYFGTFLDGQGDWIDTIHFPPVARQYPFRGKGLYLLNGVVKEDFGVLVLEINSMQKIPYIDDPRLADQ
ncbi:MAG: DNA polymerase III subunit alpha [Chitinophagaceae bacterium]|nr:DNA polymerase III subunit alpha [Chitinophagaceae bacterium]